MPPRRVVLLALLLVLIAPATSEAKSHWHPHIVAARRYAQGRAGEVAFATIDQRGRFRGYRVRYTAPTASVIKVMLMTALLRKRHEHPLSRSDRRLLAPMIRRSDNYAATTVRNMVGGRRLRRL